MARSAVFSFPAAATAAICALQTTSGSGAFTINGTLLDGGSTMQGVNRVVLPGIQRTVSLTSTGNISGVNFTITGTDLTGAAVTETRAGPSSNTVETTAEFHTITSVTVNGSVGTNTSVGTGSTGHTNWYRCDYFEAPFNVGVQAVATATINYDVKYTADNVDTATTPQENTIAAGLTGATTTQVGALTTPATAIRGHVNSSSGSGALTLTLIQAG